MKYLRRVFAVFAGLTALFLVGATTPNTAIAPQTPNIGTTRFVQGTDAAGTYKTVYTGQTNGSKCFALMLNHNDQSLTHLITTRIVHSAVAYDIATYTTLAPGGVGNTFTTTVNLMSAANWPGLPNDASGNGYVYLTNGDTLQLTYSTNLTSTDQINVVALCGDF